MIKEIRIYFESIEQANHFMKPTIENSLKRINIDVPIKLVKLKGKYLYYSQKIAKIIYWKDPDILISIIVDDEEIPLLLIEFSNAVFTEDHELQRFDGLIAAAENDCIFVKISPLQKESPSDHGGNVEFDFMKPYALIFREYKRIFFHIDWEVDKNNVVKVNKTYLSCPNYLKELEDIIVLILRSFIETKGIQWIEKFNKHIKKLPIFKEWIKKLSSYKFDKIEIKTSSRIKIVSNDTILGKNFLELKLNRFGHAMDPERGMLSFYGILIKNVVSKMRFSKDNDAWYKDIPKENEIRNYIKKTKLKYGYDFLYCFMLGSGLYNNEDFKNIVRKYEKNKSKTLTIDITDFIKKNFENLSKPLRTIFRFSRGFYIEDDSGSKRVIFVWDLNCLEENVTFKTKITPLRPLNELDEDLVTYITIHNVLRPNGFKIIAASYPGAQADRVILIEFGKGRRQQRRYIDIVSYLPSKHITALQENKGKFTKSEIKKDITELSKYKRVESYKKALERFQERFYKKAKGSLIKIGVGFWSSKNFSLSKIKDIPIEDLDYFVLITRDMKKWKIWRTGDGNIFNKMEGKVKIPKIYEVIPIKNKSTTLLEYCEENDENSKVG